MEVLDQHSNNACRDKAFGLEILADFDLGIC